MFQFLTEIVSTAFYLLKRQINSTVIARGNFYPLEICRFNPLEICIYLNLFSKVKKDVELIEINGFFMARRKHLPN